MVGALFDRLIAAGVDLQYAAGRLRFRAPKGALTEELRESVGALRSALIVLVEGGAVLPWVVSDWPEAERDAFEERVAIREFDGGAKRDDAEREAEREVRADFARRFLGQSAPRGSS